MSTLKAICPLPWIHLATHPGGGVSPCCEVDFTNANGLAQNQNPREFLSLNESTLFEIYNSDLFKQVRKEMLHGIEPDICSKCYEYERNGIKSKRQYALDDYETFEMPREPKYQFVELRLGNVCNLKCRTCNPASSSAWRKEYAETQDSLDFMRKYEDINSDWVESDEFWNDLLDCTRDLDSLYINGGEPLLIKKHKWYLEQLVEEGRAENISLKYSTNGTIIDEDVFELWSKFKRVIVMVSIDDVGDRNSYIRHPTVWEDVERFVDLLDHHNIDWIPLQTISAMNFVFLDDLYQWASQRGKTPSYNFVKDPYFLSPHALRKTDREEFFASTILPDQLKNSLKYWVDKDDDAVLRDQFKRYTEQLDSFRNENFAQLFGSLL